MAIPDLPLSNPPPPHAGLRIRPATADDLPAINDISNHYILHSTSTYEEQPSTLDMRRKWLAEKSPQHPVIVAELDGELVGWASIGPFKARSAYRHTVESSLYVRPDMHRRGIGLALLADLVDRARRLGHHTIIAIIDSEQAPSLQLHRRLGFHERGRLVEVGHKFGRHLDVIYMQLMLQQ